jgi:predicted O-methyltransferase YrrM
MTTTQTLAKPARKTAEERYSWNLNGISIGLIGQAGAWFELEREEGSVIVRPTRPLPRRCTIRPAALFHQERGFPDISTVMGRLVFANGATEPQRYTPFTRDPQRTLKELFLPVEPMPEDEWLNSSVRWTNAIAITRRLLAAAKVQWKGLPSDQIQQLVDYVHCTEPVESCTLHAMTQHFHKTGECIIEIGSFRGRSISALALGLRGVGSEAKIFSIDPHIEQPLNEQQVRLTLAQLGEQQRVVQYVGSSDDASKLLRPGCASLIFIDGDHSYRQVVNDFENYKNILAPGGCMVFHDYGFGNHSGQEDAQPEVRPAVDDHVLTAGFKPLLLAQVLLVAVRVADSPRSESPPHRAGQ